MRVRRFVLARVILAVASAMAAAHPAGAQTSAAPDSLPARAGTWGLEGGLGSGTATLGALRFVAPRAALGVAVVARSASQTSETTASFGSTAFEDGQRSTFTNLSLDLGYRRYTRPREALATFATVGPTVEYARGTNAGGAATTHFESRYTQVGVGAFGEIGATYLPVRRVGVNASAQLRVARLFGSNRSGNTGPAGTQGVEHRTRGWTADFGLARLSATLFF